MGKIVFIFALALGQVCWAGVTELSLSTSYRNQRIDDDNFTESLSFTGSVAYYFWEMSALEFSYTSGESKQSLKESSSSESTISTTEFKLYGLDFVLSFADRKAAFQPFVKIGAAKMDKTYKLDPVGDIERTTGTQKGIAPSAGVGARIRFTQTFSIKLGLDAWSSPIDDDDSEPDTIDYAGRVGVSWMF